MPNSSPVTAWCLSAGILKRLASVHVWSKALLDLKYVTK